MNTFNLSTPSGTLHRACRMAEMQYEYPISDNFNQSQRKTPIRSTSRGSLKLIVKFHKKGKFNVPVLNHCK
jgi:hypothetical protein